MPTRTIPVKFPNMGIAEGYGMMPYSASLIRKLALSQNFNYAHLRRTYANHAYEGVGAILGYASTTHVPVEGIQLPTIAGAAPFGLGVPVSSFYVPRNWGGGTRVEINGRSTFNRSHASNDAQIWAVLYNLDETPTGVAAMEPAKLVGTFDWTITLRVPQDKDYQIKVFLVYKSVGGDSWAANNVNTSFVSARYMAADVVDLGYTPPDGQTFQVMRPNTLLAANDSGNALWLTRLIENTGFLWSHAGPELCQSYLGNPWNNTAAFVEVGRYVFRWHPSVSSIGGKLYCFLTHGGAGCEVRVLLNGVVKQTWTALGTGYQTLTVSAINSSHTPGANNTFTVEAKNVSSASWGTVVWGVHMWDTALTAALAVEAPTAYQPLDESALRGDKPIVWKDDAVGRRAGLWYLLRNDHWLHQHRALRGLIGDFRHYVLKRAGVFSATTDVDARADWTRGDNPNAYQPGPRNISIRGTAGTDGNIPLGAYPNGIETGSDWNGVPFVYPSVGSAYHQGWTLGRYIAEVPAGVTNHQSYGSNTRWAAYIRGRRCRPALMAVDTNGAGPLPEESPYRNHGYFELSYNGSVVGQRSTITNHGTRPDEERQWHPTVLGLHTSGSMEIRLRGRLPPQISGGYSTPTGVTRPEGALFEVELNSVFLCDEPIAEAYLQGLP